MSRLALLLALGALMLRIALPPGLMPAASAEGLVITLCSGGQLERLPGDPLEGPQRDAPPCAFAHAPPAGPEPARLALPRPGLWSTPAPRMAPPVQPGRLPAAALPPPATGPPLPA